MVDKHSNDPYRRRTTEDPSTSKRRGRNASRVGMACVPCRQSTLKCDGDKPRCQRCTGRNQSCYWVALDGRSTEAKKRRKSSPLLPTSADQSAIDQLQLLANTAVQGDPSRSYPSSATVAMQGFGAYVPAVGQAGPAFYGSSSAGPSHSLPPPPPQPASAPQQQQQQSHQQLQDIAPFTNDAVLKPAIPTTWTPLSDFGFGNAANQQMWWERGTSTPAPRRNTPAPPLGGAGDATPSLDLASLGLEPQFLTEEMIDMLTGKVVWIDQPPTMNGVRAAGGGGGGDGSSNAPTDNGSLKPEDAISTVASTASDNVQPASGSSVAASNVEQSGAGSSNGSGGGGVGREANEDVGVVRMQYFRLMGPTGISPGIKKITMELKLTPTVRRALFDSDSPNARPQGAHLIDWERLINDGSISVLPRSDDDANASANAAAADKDLSSSDVDEDDGKSATSARPDFFDGDLPAPWVIQELVPIFFDRLGDHYLCLNRQALEIRLGLAPHTLTTILETGQRSVPPMLLNVMCALAARFSVHPRIVNGRSMQRAHTFGKRFARKAKEFLVPSLAVPSSATVLAFIMMAWHEFACNLDSAFWNYGGMGLRMAIDLGLQRYSPITAPQFDLIDDCLLFWAVYMMDRHLCVGTGRPTSIKDREITCPQPAKDQLLFAYHINHVRIGGRIAETINAVLTPDKKARTEIQHGLDHLETELIKSYESIPAHLRLNAANFKASEQKHLFFEFHLWFHNLLLILNRSPIVEMRSSVLPLDAAKLVRKSVQRCADVLAMDDTYDNEVLKSVPMANQTLFLAGCAELDESAPRQDERDDSMAGTHDEHRAGNGRTSRAHLIHEAQEGYRRFADALDRISVYWDGVRWIHGVLSQRKLGHSHTDLVELAVGTDALVSKREMRLLRRHGALSDVGSTSSSSSRRINDYVNVPVEISNIGSLDELTSLLPQVQSAIAAQSS